MEKNIIIISEGCILDLNTDTITVNGKERPLKGRMGRLIRYLAVNRGQDLTSDQICQYVYQDEYFADRFDPSRLDDLLHHIKIRLSEELRNCIKKGGVGYYFQPPTDGTGHALIAELHYALGEFRPRDTEMAKLRQLFETGQKPIVIWGEGGIGKTELALQFCKKLKTAKCYFVRYNNSIKDTIAGLSFSNTPENHKNLSVEEKFEKHIKWLEEHDDTNLLILDNFDDDSKTLTELLADQDLARVCQLRFKLIITTRNKPQFPMSNAIHLESLPETELLELIKHYYQRWETDGTTEDELIALIRALDGHTLCCELAAKTLQASHKLKPKDVLVSLHGNNDEESLAIVDTEKDRRGYSGRITDHIKKLYNISALTAEEIETMRYVLLTSPSGIDHSLLLDVNFGVQQAPLQALIKKGWLSKAQNTDLITIHPVVRSFCMLTPELQPTLIEERFLDFIDNLYAFAGNPHDRTRYLQVKRQIPYAEWRKEEKKFYRQWEQVSGMTHFLTDSVEHLVSPPTTIEQAKCYFDYVETFLDLRQERKGPTIPWEEMFQYNLPLRYLAKSTLGISLGRNLAFRMRSLAFEFLQKNISKDDAFWARACDHMGRSYDSKSASSDEEKAKNKFVAKDCFEKALGVYLRWPSMYTAEILLLYERLSNNPKVDHTQQLSYALSAVTLIDEYALTIPLDCAMFCKRIAYLYKERAVHHPDADVQQLLRADRKWYSVGKPLNTKLSPAQTEDFQNVLQWLMREECEYLSAYADIIDFHSNMSIQASQKNHQLADVYDRIGYVYGVLNNFEKELEYRLSSVRFACDLSDRTYLSKEIIEEYFAISQCQYDLRLYSDCLETCCNITTSICSTLADAAAHREGESLRLKGDNAARIIQNYSAELIAADSMAICCCCELEEYEKAVEFGKRLEVIGYWNYEVFNHFRLCTYTNMSICYGKQMDIEKQCDFEAKVLDIKRNSGLINLQEFLDESIKMAARLIKRERFATARSHLLRIITIYDENPSQEELSLDPQIYVALAQCLQKLGDNKRANMYLLIHAEATGKKLYAKFLRWLLKLWDE